MRDGIRGRQTGVFKAIPRLQAISGYVSEMFCSVQGEGLYMGERQLFFRTAGCSETCYWCDTLASKVEREYCVVRGKERRTLPNPLSANEAIKEVLDLAMETDPVSVSITGGEPLEQSDFVAAVARELKRKNLQVYLETSGLEVSGLTKIRPYADVVAMDIKLPHATGKAHWDTHREFLKWLVGKKAFVKVVVDSTTPLEEIEAAIHLIAEVDRGFPLVLQPESSTYLKDETAQQKRRGLLELLDKGQRIGLQSLKDVRVIPQCHKVMGAR